METNDWLDYLVAFSTALAAFGTLAAVLVTLYFNVWRSRAGQPKLSIDFIEESEFGVGWTPAEPSDEFDSFGLTKIVRNERGRTTAHDVQVLSNLAIELDSGEWHDHFIQQPLVWAFAKRRGGVGSIYTDIPSGVGRRIFTILIGDPNAVYAQFHPYHREQVAGPASGHHLDDEGNPMIDSMPIAGAVAFHPLNQDNIEWIYRERKYRFRFTITARDVDAVVYETFLTFSEETHTQHTLFLQPHWTDLKKLKPEELSND